MENKLFLLGVAALISVALVPIIASFFEPKLTHLDEIDISYLDKVVSVQGKIADATEYQNSAKAIIEEDGTRMRLYITGKVRLLKDYCVRAVGNVQIYQGGLEIVVEPENLRDCVLSS